MRILLLVPFVLLAGCPPTEPADVPPSPSPIKPPDTDLCDDMCSHIGPEGLKCEEGEDLYDDDFPGEPGVPNRTCAEDCRTLQGKGVFVNPRCIQMTPTCEEIEDYRAKDPETCEVSQGDAG